jgi:RNA polymerase sigma-70 factor (ECF subfamily)
VRPCHERVHLLLSTGVAQLVAEEPVRVTYLDDDDVVRDLYPALFRYAAVVGAGSHDPDDLVQEALVAALRAQSLIDLQHPQAYLRRAILTAAMNRQRRRGLFSRAAPKLAEPEGVDAHYRSDLDDLEPGDRALLYLVYVEGLSFAEVADQLDDTEPNCRQRASRARKLLRETLRDEESSHE